MPKLSSIIKKNQSIRLDVGCGNNKQAGFVGMDKRKLKGVDIVHDLEKFPWPIPDNSCSVVVLSHVWEHIKPWLSLNVMDEIWRVSRPNGLVMLAGPYGVGFRFVQDPTHCNPVNDATFTYFDPLHPSGLYGVYQTKPLHLERFEIVPIGMDRDFEVAMRVCKGKCNHAKSQ